MPTIGTKNRYQELSMFRYDSTRWAQSYCTSCQILFIIPHMPPSGAKENSLTLKKNCSTECQHYSSEHVSLTLYYSTICHPTLIDLYDVTSIHTAGLSMVKFSAKCSFKVLPVCIANNWIYFTLLWDRGWQFLVRHKNCSLENLYKLYSLACNCSTSTENIFQIRGYKENLG